MSNEDSSTSSEELDGTSERFNPTKALYSKRTVTTAGGSQIYDNLQMFMSARKHGDSVLPVGHKEEVARRDKEKIEAREAAMRELEEINKRRFTAAQALTAVPRRQRPTRDVLTRIEKVGGPLAALRDCMENRIRIKVVTRGATGVRGQLIGLLEAFDKQWNLALSDVLEIWRRKVKTKRKVPPAMGTPCETGTAAARFPGGRVTETRVGPREVECTRHVPQLLVRGEHVVLLNILDRWRPGADPTQPNIT